MEINLKRRKAEIRRLRATVERQSETIHEVIDAFSDALHWLKDAPDAGRPSEDAIDEARNILRAALARATGA